MFYTLSNRYFTGSTFGSPSGSSRSPSRNRIRHQISDSSVHILSNGLRRIALNTPATDEPAMTSDASTTSSSESLVSPSGEEPEFEARTTARQIEDGLSHEAGGSGLLIIPPSSHTYDMGSVSNTEAATEDDGWDIVEPVLPALIPIYSGPSNKTVRSWGGTEPALPDLTPIYPWIPGKTVRPWGTDDEIFVVGQSIQVHVRQTSATEALPCNAPASSSQDSNTRPVGPGAGVVIPSGMSATEMFQCLTEHGCADVSSRINHDRHSTTAAAGGSFGDIWIGEMDGGVKIAIKCYRFHTITIDCPKGLKRATREMYTWSKAKHPNVQELIGVTMFQGRLGMVSLWMENGNLREYMQRNPKANRYQLCVQVATGVSYLHSIDIVHGDIKALNILVSHDGVAKLSDFDHSILSNCTLMFSATTNVGGGTLRWMAPELLARTEDEGSPPAARTTQTDVYALGMTILEILTGKVPYSEYGQDMGILRAMDKKQPPSRPRILVETNEQSNETWKLLLRCWDHDAVARPGASSVLDQLQSAINKIASSS